MVDLPVRPLTMNIKPNNSVDEILAMVDVDNAVTMEKASGLSNYCMRLYRKKARKFPGFRIIRIIPAKKSQINVP